MLRPMCRLSNFRWGYVTLVRKYINYLGVERIKREKISHPLFLESIGSSINNTLAFFCLRFTLFTCRVTKERDLFANFSNDTDFVIKSRFYTTRQGTYHSRPERITSQFMPHKHSFGYGRRLWETETIHVTPTTSSHKPECFFFFFSQSCCDFTVSHFWLPLSRNLGTPHLPHHSPHPHGWGETEMAAAPHSGSALWRALKTHLWGGEHKERRDISQTDIE